VRAFRSGFSRLFNSYDDDVGAPVERAKRGPPNLEPGTLLVDMQRAYRPIYARTQPSTNCCPPSTVMRYTEAGIPKQAKTRPP
jgi:hypothetical protein